MHGQRRTHRKAGWGCHPLHPFYFSLRKVRRQNRGYFLKSIGFKTLCKRWRGSEFRDLRSLSEADVLPAHGDAHLGNLLASPQGWLWIDFEDASRMPRFWDLACAL
ncbi:phosphotransferase family protein [Calditerricola satsumensis]|uniref:phosphotransferase family protein n=1 Tax=Calditerricola satsumensis TaxID=373054 RepID=UPI001E36C71F|nr:phosphotransferase [Calditerricola satsumensis]